MKGAVADDADVGLGNAEEPGDVGAGLLIVEAHDDHGAMALIQALDATGELLLIDARRGGLDRNQLIPELFQELFPPLGVTAQIENHHPAGSQDEGDEFVPFAQAARAKSFEDGDQDLLRKILRSMLVSQVAQAVEADSGSHAAQKLSLGVTIASGTDSSRQFAFGSFNFHHLTFYV
jgi:hypothetical protein